MPNSEMKQGVFWPEKVEEFEKQTPLENLDCETVTHDNRKETEQHNEVVGTFDVLAVESQRIFITGGSLNVKCASQIVFNSHVIGKKYLENLKQFHGHSSLYGEAELQALYLSDLNTSKDLKIFL